MERSSFWAQVPYFLLKLWILTDNLIANAAFPHGGSTDRQLQKEDFILIDAAASLHGYKSDITRVSHSGEMLELKYTDCSFQQTFALEVIILLLAFNKH